MGDDERGLPLRELLEALEDRLLGLRIERRGGLVEHEDVRLLAHEAARERHLLPLAPRELDAVLEPLSERGLDAGGEVGDERVRAALLHGALDSRHLLEVLDAADADVLAELQLVLVEVLEHDAEPREQVGAIPGAEILAVEEDAALGRLVEARDELHQRRLAGAVLSDERDALPARDEEIDVAKDPLVVLLLTGIAEAHVLEADALLARAVSEQLRRRRRDRLRLGLVLRGDGAVEVREEVRHVEVVLVDAPDAAQDRLERRLAAPERKHVHRHVAERELRRGCEQRHRAVRDVERAGREEREQRRDDRAPRRELGILGVEALRELLVSSKEHRPEPKELHLLRVLVVGEDVFEVDEAPRVGRAPVAQAKRRLREAHLRDRRRHRGEHQREDDPAAELEQERGIAREREEVLDERERLGHERHRPRRGLAARAAQLVVELGVLEVAEFERRRALEDRDVHVRAEARAEDAPDETETAGEGCLQDDETELHADPLDGVVVRTRDDGVDDPLARPRDRGRDGRHEQRRDGKRDREALGRAPDEPEGAPGVRRAVPHRLLQGLRGQFLRRFVTARTSRRAQSG